MPDQLCTTADNPVWEFTFEDAAFTVGESVSLELMRRINGAAAAKPAISIDELLSVPLRKAPQASIRNYIPAGITASGVFAERTNLGNFEVNSKELTSGGAGFLQKIAASAVWLSALCWNPTSAVPNELHPTSTARSPKYPRSAQSLRTSLDQMAEHNEFIRRMATVGSPPPISMETAARANQVWFKLWDASKCALPVPAATAGPEGQVFYSWDRGRHHFEVEIIPGKDDEYFYRDRETGEYWGEDVSSNADLPVEVIERLKFFI